MNEHSQVLAQVDRLVNSHTLHGSEALCRLLRYLATHATEHPGIPLKEYQIATELFGRPANFDPQLDSMVRVQAGRLRTKLSEYYASEGVDDPLILELPKGTYLLSIHPRSQVGPRHSGNGQHEAVREGFAEASGTRGLRLAVGVLGGLLALALLVIAGLLFLKKPARDVAAAPVDQVAPEIRSFWKGFLTSSEEPWVIFSNAAFVGRPDTGLRYVGPNDDKKTQIFDHYTGVGEVLAVHNLDGVFNLLHQPIRVKRGSLFSLDDAKNNDLIFIGSPSENLTLLLIPSTKEFVFQSVPEGPRKGNMEIVNRHALAGEQTDYLATPSGQPLSEDFAVIALERGINPSHNELILAGTTTLGTQAAVEYICGEDSMRLLFSKLTENGSGEIKPFEALLKVKVTRGVPVGTELISVRKTEQ